MGRNYLRVLTFSTEQKKFFFSEKTILCVRGALDNIDEATLKKSFDGAVQSYIVKDNQSGRKR